jgi:hypothetical protein
MAAMLRATGTAGPAASLPAPALAEMADLCAACPRTDACRQWLARHGTTVALPPDTLCPNSATFAALQATAAAPPDGTGPLS